MKAFKPFLVYVGIYLGCADARMAQQFLDDAQVRPVAQKVRCKGMAHQVWEYMFIQSRQFRSFLDNLSDSVTRQFPTANAQEYMGGLSAFYEKGTGMPEIKLQGFQGLVPNGNQPCFASLACDAKVFFLFIQMLQPKPG